MENMFSNTLLGAPQVGTWLACEFGYPPLCRPLLSLSFSNWRYQAFLDPGAWSLGAHVLAYRVINF